MRSPSGALSSPLLAPWWPGCTQRALAQATPGGSRAFWPPPALSCVTWWHCPAVRARLQHMMAHDDEADGVHVCVKWQRVNSNTCASLDRSGPTARANTTAPEVAAQLLTELLVQQSVACLSAGM